VHIKGVSLSNVGGGEKGGGGRRKEERRTRTRKKRGRDTAIIYLLIRSDRLPYRQR